MSAQTFENTLVALNFVSAFIVVYLGVFHIINAMTKRTFFPVRLAWLLLTTGALAVLVGPLYGYSSTSVTNLLIHIGLATLVCFERRPPKEQEHDTPAIG